ncbi:MAG: hypothetical protein E6Q88_06340 [Lysobacteraceae bacterium]|nr:MAG: hypothetical protein E6Q88_06340 [Xanthomonadaceae bacterium]
MVAIVGGNGLGLFNTSLNTLGGAGVIGQGRQGLYGGAAYVNAANGNLILQAMDEQLSGRGLDLGHLRTYNAQGLLDDGDGDGWRWDGERRIAVNGAAGQTGSTVTRIGGDGHATAYAWDTTQQRYVSSEGDGAHDGFVYDEPQRQWVWTDGDTRMVERYTASTRRLASVTDASGNRIDTLYDANGRLSQVVDAGSGQRLVLTYATVAGTALTRLSKVETRALATDAAGRATTTLGALMKQVEYGYDSLGRLTSVKTDLTPENTADHRFYVTGYTYDGASFRVASILQGDGTAAGTAYANFSYEQVGASAVYRVKTVTDAGGTHSFDYSIANQTRVSDDSGREWRYLYDAQQRLTEIRSPAATAGGAALSTRFEYDVNGNVIRATDALGKTTTYQYDAQGNRTLERDALGNTVTWTYDARNQVTTETRYRIRDLDGEGAGLPADPETVRYAYDAKSRLRFVVSAEGRVTEHRYVDGGTVYGQLERTLSYAAGRYPVAALATTDTLSETQLTTWLSQSSPQDRAQAQMSQYAYDLRGNVSKRTDFANLNATTGEGVLDAAATVTEYIYDGYGRLLQTIAVRGAARDQRTVLTSVTFDGMGRELALVSAEGTSITAYDDTNGTISLTTGAGLTILQSYDVRGRLIAVNESDGATNRISRYVYDAQGRLRMQAQVGANNNNPSDDLRSYSFYDNAGRLQYSVDATGAVTAMAYDDNGHLIQQTQYRNRANTSGWFDTASGTVTKHALTVGGAGSDVLSDAAHDRVTAYVYDDAGRLLSQTDAANAVTVTTYDGASRVTRLQSGDRIERYFYDRDGHRIGMLDAMNYLTEYKYDAAGRLVETIRYDTPSPREDNSAAVVWTGVTNRTIDGARPFEYRLPAAYDPDGDTLVYSVVSVLPPWLSFDATGLRLYGTPPAAATSYSVTLRVSDGHPTAPKHAEVTLSLTIANTAPSWTILADRQVAVNTTGFSLTLPAASDANSGAGALVYSIAPSLLPPGVGFDATTRTLSGTPNTPGSYVIAAQVRDPQGAVTERRFVLTVTNQGPRWNAIDPLGIPEARVNTDYAFTVPAAIDPEGQTLNYSAISLPAGLSFDAATRRVSGRPQQASRVGNAEQPQTVVLSATDAHGRSVRLAFSVTVRNDAPAGDGWGGSQALGTVMSGVGYTFTPPPPSDPEGQTLSYALVAGGLPPGMAFNPATGGVSGSSASVGAYQWTVSAHDPHGAFVTQTYQLTVLNAPPAYLGGLSAFLDLDGGDTLDLDVGNAFTDINGHPLSFSYSGKPSWVNVSADGRHLTGTPTASGISTMTVTVNDGQGGTTTVSFQIQVVGSGENGPPNRQSLPGGQRQGLGLSDDPGLTAQALLPPLTDALAGLRPSGASSLRSHLFYDAQGRITGTVDERGFLSETVYDAHGNRQQSLRYLKAVTVNSATDTLADVRGRAGAATTTTLAYDGYGRPRPLTNTDGMVSRNQYDSAGRLVRRIAAEGAPEQRSSRTRYNAFGEITGTLGGVGDATLGETPSQTQIDAAIARYGVRYEYDSFGRQVKATDANGHRTWFYYDQDNRLTHTVNAEGEVEETTYDAFGQATSTRRYATWLTATQREGLSGGYASSAFLSMLTPDAARDAVTAHAYDRMGRLLSTLDPEGVATTYAYTQYGQLAGVTRALSAGATSTSVYGYNLRGENVLRTEDIGGLNHNTRTEYDAYGRVVRTIDGAGHAVQISYQDNGRIVVVTDALGRMERTESDAFGRVVARYDALNRSTRYEFDDTERSVKMTTPEGVVVTTVKTAHGETLRVTDGRGNITRYEYDRDGRLRTVTDALNQKINEQIYDDSGRLSQIVDARGTVTVLRYDAVNRVIEREIDPDGLKLRTLYEFPEQTQTQMRVVRTTEGAGTSAARVTEMHYDRNDRLVQTVIDPTGLKLSTYYHYDAAGNISKIERGTKDQPAQEVTRYTFDALGRRTRGIVELREPLSNGQIAVRDLITEYRYDAAGRLSRMIDAAGNSTWYAYDAAGQLQQTINALGEVDETLYDANGRVEQTRRYAVRAQAEQLASFGDSAGIVTLAASETDRRELRVYDNDGRQRYVLQAANGDDWIVHERRYDANGNVIETFRYDRFLDEARVNAIAAEGFTVAEIAAELAAMGYAGEDTLGLSRHHRYAYDANNRLRFSVDALGGVNENVYDASGAVVAQLRYATSLQSGAYDESSIDAAVSRNDARNQVVRNAYDAAGRLRFSVRVAASDAQGVATQHLLHRQDYDALGRVVQTIAYATALGAVADYREATLAAAAQGSAQDRRSAMVYDSAGRQVYTLQASALDAQGHAIGHIATKSEYDAFGHVLRSIAYAKTVGAIAAYTQTTVAAAIETDIQDRAVDMVYDSAGRQRFQIAADGGLSETIYDALGRAQEQRQYALILDKTTTWTEAALSAQRGGRILGDGETRGVHHGYDALSRIVSTTDAMGYSESWTYDALGDKTAYTNKNGHTWTYQYDRQGRLTLQTAPAVLLQWNAGATPTLQAMRTALEYDAFGNLTRRTEAHQTPAARATLFEYDRLGRQILSIEPGWYDPATGTVVAEQAPGRFQRATKVSYDLFGNAVRSQTRHGAGENDYLASYRAYDALGRLSHEVDALGSVTAHTYTAFGEQRTTTRHSVTLGAPPSGREYWHATEIAAQTATDAQSRTTTTSYDALGRRIEVRGPAAQRYYSGVAAAANPGVATTTDGAAVTQYQYNAFGEIHREAVQIDATRWNETWRYYDAAGREVRSIDALGYHTTRGYDALGNMTETVEYANAGPAGASGQYMPPPPPASSADDRITAFEYDARDQLVTIRRKGLRYSQWNGNAYVQLSNGRDVATTMQTMQYDGVGRVTVQTDAAGNATTTVYNALGHQVLVTEASRAVGRTSIAGGPDPFRNQIQTTLETHFAYDAFGRTVELSKTAAGQTVFFQQNGFDVAGNQIYSSGWNGSKAFEYDYAGRVIRQTVNAGDSSMHDWNVAAQTLDKRIVYDALGRQIAELDIYAAGTQQSGTRKLYNSFGEVTAEKRVWGASSSALDGLTSATVASYAYDRAGQITSKQAADGKTVYYYDLAGQTTRVEQRGNESDADGTKTRISETGYDLRGRAVIQRLPAFAAVREAFVGIGEAITPVTEQAFDRWGNIVERAQGRYVLNIGGDVRSEQRAVTRYAYNADDRMIREESPTATAWRENGLAYQVKTTHILRYDLLGRAVEELDVADDAGTAAVEQTELRKRSREYDAVGQLRAETDATGIRTEYIYDALGQRIGTRNAAGTVFVEAYNGRGQLVDRSVLRLAGGEPYDSRNPQHLAANTVTHKLVHHFYDDAGRRTRTSTYDHGNALSERTEYALYDERGLLLAIRDPAFVTTRYAYDAQGQKTAQWTGERILQNWSYDSGDYTLGRLNASLQSNGHVTTYAYDDFGQVAQESYGAAIGARTYAYHDNGLLRQRVDAYRAGTQGSIGGADYLDTAETTQYDYSVLGRQARESFQRTGVQEVMVYDGESRTWRLEEQGLPALARSVRTQYDALGRALEVRSENPDGGAKLESLTYGYDELGNRRRIRAQFQRAADIASEVSDRWYAYDREGRMTVAEGGVSNGAVTGGTKLRYDALGRRTGSEKMLGVRSDTDPETGVLYVWKDYREERYAYNDLGHLIKVSQRLNRREMTSTAPGGSPRPQPDDMGEWYDHSLRTVDDRGTVQSIAQYSDVVSESWQQDRIPKLKSITASTYRLDGRLNGQTVTVYKTDGTVDAALSSRSLNYLYDTDGKLQSYLYEQGSGTAEYFNNSYSYEYVAVFGADREKRISVVSSKPGGASTGQTTSAYDHRGRLIRQSIDMVDGVKTRLFSYDGDGRILVKEEAQRKTDGTLRKGRQDLFYAHGEEAAAVSSGVLGNNDRFNSGYTPISAAYPASSASSHVVQRGDTLSGIAYTVFGDSALWYLIAEENGLNYGPSEALPATEEGRTLRIPNKVSNLRNNAGTFRPYNPAEVIGDATPTPTISRHQCINEQAAWMVQTLTTVITTAATMILTAYLGPIGGIIGGAVGAATNNLVRQGIAMGNGAQKNFNWGGLGTDALVGGVASAFGGAGGSSFAGQAVAGLASYTLTEAAEYAQTPPEQRNFRWSQFGVGAGLSVLGTALGRVSGKVQDPNAVGGVRVERLPNGVRGAITTAVSLATQNALGEKPNVAAAASGYVGRQIGFFFGGIAARAIERETGAPKPDVRRPSAVRVTRYPVSIFANNEEHESGKDQAPVIKIGISTTYNPDTGEEEPDQEDPKRDPLLDTSVDMEVIVKDGKSYAIITDDKGVKHIRRLKEEEPDAPENQESTTKSEGPAPRNAQNAADKAKPPAPVNEPKKQPSTLLRDLPYGPVNDASDMAGGIIEWALNSLPKLVRFIEMDDRLAQRYAIDAVRRGGVPWHPGSVDGLKKNLAYRIQNGQPTEAVRERLAKAEAKLEEVRRKPYKAHFEKAGMASDAAEDLARKVLPVAIDSYAPLVETMKWARVGLESLGKAADVVGVITDFGARVFGDASPAQRSDYKVMDGFFAAASGYLFGAKHPFLAALDAAQGLVWEEKPLPISDTVKGSISVFTAITEAIDTGDPSGLIAANKKGRSNEWGRFIRAGFRWGEYSAYALGGVERAHYAGNMFKRHLGAGKLERTAAFVGAMPVIGNAFVGTIEATVSIKRGFVRFHQRLSRELEIYSTPAPPKIDLRNIEFKALKNTAPDPFRPGDLGFGMFHTAKIGH